MCIHRDYDDDWQHLDCFSGNKGNLGFLDAALDDLDMARVILFL